MKRASIVVLRSFLLLFLVFVSGMAQQGSWKFIGLQDEGITAIAIDPHNYSTIFAGSYSDFSAGTYGSIFKSSDGGVSWDTLVYGVSVNQLEINPKNSDIIYAALGGANFTHSGILKSTNGGLTWFWADSGIYVDWETLVQCIAIDPFYPDTLYAGTGGFFGGTLYKSINAGSFWTDIGDTTGLRDGVVSLSIDPQSSNILYSTTAWRGYLYKSINGGLSWQEIIPPFEGHLVHSLVVDPVCTDVLYAGASMLGLYKSMDAGLSWFRSDSGIPGQTGMDIVIDPSNHTILYAGTYSQGVFYSTNSATSWTAMNQGLDTLWIRSLAITPDAKTLFAGTYDGIYKYELNPQTIFSDDKEFSIHNYRLYSNYPNPFNSQTQIEYDLPKHAFVNLTIFNILGQEVKNLVNEVQSAGHYRISWDGSDAFRNPVSSGVYIYRLETQEYSYSRKMLYLK